MLCYFIVSVTVGALILAVSYWRKWFGRKDVNLDRAWLYAVAAATPAVNLLVLARAVRRWTSDASNPRDEVEHEHERDRRRAIAEQKVREYERAQAAAKHNQQETKP